MEGRLILSCLFSMCICYSHASPFVSSTAIYHKVGKVERRQTHQHAQVLAKLEQQAKMIQQLIEMQEELSARLSSPALEIIDAHEQGSVQATDEPARTCVDPSDEGCFSRDCSEITPKGEAGEDPSGVYVIYVGEEKRPLNVYCHFSQVKPGAGWLVFQKRLNGKVDFNKHWNEYVKGFGEPSGEYWLGLDHLHNILSGKDYELLIEMKQRSRSTEGYALYSSFKVLGPSNSYKMYLGDFVGGNAGDSLSKHSGSPFSTADKDNDNSSGNCAKWYGGGYWYHSCFDSNLNGLYQSRGTNGVNWKTFGGFMSLEEVKMMIRPASTTN